MKKDANSILKNIFDTASNAVQEGYEILPTMDKEKYQERDGLEGPIMTRSGKVVYYDPGEGAYYDPTSDFYISNDEFTALDNESMRNVREEMSKDYEAEIDKIIAEIKDLGVEDPQEIASVVDSFIDDEDDAVEVYVTVLDFLGLAESVTELNIPGTNTEFNPNFGHRDQPSHPENQGLGNQQMRPKARPKKLAPATSLRPRSRPTYSGAGGTSELAPNGQMTGSTRGVSETLSPEEKRLVSKMYNKDGTLTDLGRRVMGHDTPKVEEGHSPHKKGTAKYKKHMAAMHAEDIKENPTPGRGDGHAEVRRRQQDAEANDFLNRVAAHKQKTDHFLNTINPVIDHPVAVGLRNRRNRVKEYAIDDPRYSPNASAINRRDTRHDLEKLQDLMRQMKQEIGVEPDKAPIRAPIPADGNRIASLKVKEEAKVSISQVKESISTKSTDKNRIVADYIGGYLTGNLNESQVKAEIAHVASRISESVDVDTVYKNMTRTNIQEQLDKKLSIRESIAQLQNIVDTKSMQAVKFSDGSMKIDMTTASLVLSAYSKVKPENQAKIEKMIETKGGFKRLLDIIYK
tara:strand:+ start:1890 stop:3608 length:1719 start_codon:yes stop_codon:yes gene_type:complete